MLDQLIATGLIPDFLLRLGIRNFLKQRLVEENLGSFEDIERKRQRLIQELHESPIAIETNKANDQHYQVPTEFYDYCLGEHKKYSCCYYKNEQDSLEQAEANMLDRYIQRGAFADGQKVLDLGCGWGSFSLYAAQKFKNSHFTLVSNSATQKVYIDSKAKALGLSNIEVLTCDANALELQEKYDRVISIEMFEHMRNYDALLQKIDHFLSKDGKLFVHIFVHKNRSYKFDNKDATDWMSRYFFSGGIMPSENLLFAFQKNLVIRQHWNVCGLHYGKTARHWLENMDRHKEAILKVFSKHYGREANKWFHYWRIFFLSCEELWNYKAGSEWYVSHYLFEKR